MASYVTMTVEELTTRASSKVLVLVNELKPMLQKMGRNEGKKVIFEKGDDPKSFRQAIKLAAASLGKKARFPRRGEKVALCFYLEDAQEPLSAQPHQTRIEETSEPFHSTVGRKPAVNVETRDIPASRKNIKTGGIVHSPGVKQDTDLGGVEIRRAKFLASHLSANLTHGSGLDLDKKRLKSVLDVSAEDSAQIEKVVYRTFAIIRDRWRSPLDASNPQLHELTTAISRLRNVSQCATFGEFAAMLKKKDGSDYLDYGRVLMSGV